MDNFDLQILQKTLNFIDENCVGPQRAQYLYSEIKSTVDNPSSLSYQYFISLFENKELITRAIVCEKINKFNNFDNKKAKELKPLPNFDDDDWHDDEFESFEKPNISNASLNKGIDEDELYFYVGDIRIYKQRLFQFLYAYYVENNIQDMSIETCYQCLQEYTYRILSKEALKKIFSNNENVTKKDIRQKLLPLIRRLNLKESVLRYRLLWLNIIETLGIEFTKELLKNGIYKYIPFSNALSELNGETTTSLIEDGEYKLLYEEDSNNIMEFFDSFEEDDLIKLLKNEELLEKKTEAFTLCKEMNIDGVNISQDDVDKKVKYLIRLKQIKQSRRLDLYEGVLKYRLSWLNIIETLGVEFAKELLKSGIHKYIPFSNALSELTGEATTSLIEDGEYKLLYEEDSKNIMEFFDAFEEDDLIKMLADDLLLKKMINTYNFCKQLKIDFEDISQDNINAKIKYLMPFEITPALTKYNTVGELINEKQMGLAHLFEHKQTIINYTKVLKQSLPEFLNEKFKRVLQGGTREKYIDILSLRQQGYNMRAAGKIYGCSGTRVGQVEEQYNQVFERFYKSESGTLTRLIRAFAKNDWILTKEDICSIFSFYPELFFYLLKKEQCGDIEYIEEFDVFYFIDDVDWYKEILNISERLGDYLSETQINLAIQETHKYLQDIGVDIPMEYCEKIIKKDYIQNGTVYSKSKLSLLQKYKEVLQNIFPDGIRIYEKEDIDKFRAEYQRLFSDNMIPENDRALYGRITACCYLVDKGKYALKKDKYISDELANKIYNYIQNSPREIFLTNILMGEFEKELHEEGIKNKYHLQGVLKELFFDKLFFSRDYISKNNSQTNLYNEICNYVKQFDKPVSLEQIMKEFKNVPISVISMGLSNENIIKFSGEYICADKVNMLKEDIEYFALTMDEILLEKDYSTSYDLFDYIKENNSNILDKYNIDTHYKLFSYIQYYLEDQYELRRPYFAKKGAEIGHIRESVLEFILEAKEVTFDEIKNEFPNVSDRILRGILSVEEIICDTRTYIHFNNLKMSEDDLNYIKNTMSDLCKDNTSHSTYELLMVLDLKYPQIVDKYKINNQSRLFGIIKILFGEDFEFSRPYFANKGVKILSNVDRTVEYLRQFEEIKIADFYDYIYDNKLTIYSITDYINSLKDEYVFKDKDTIVSLECSNINKYNAQVAENVLLSAMGKDGFIVASKFKNYSFLPNDVKWTNWLLYSCMNKFSNKIKVMQTGSKMKSSEPVFVLKEIPATNVNELKEYLKNTLKLNDALFVKYLQTKGLLD